MLWTCVILKNAVTYKDGHFDIGSYDTKILINISMN